MAAARRISGLTLSRQLGSWRRPGPAYLALADTVQLLILDGRLPVRTGLPAERELSVALGVSRTTVTAAYAALRERGFLVSRRGSGSQTALPSGRTPRPPSASSGWASATLTAPTHTDLIDLTHASLPAPVPQFNEALREATADLAGHLGESGYTTLGVPELRAAVAARYDDRGLPTSPDQVMITGGAHQAFALAVRLLVGPGDRVLMEHPTYPNAIEAVRQAGGRPVPVPLGPDGWDLELLASTLRQSAPRLAFLVADFHNPTGRCMDQATRARVATMLARTNTPAVVDETLVDLGLDVEPPPPLAVHDRTGVVISAGSVSKSFWGGLRVGWIRASEPLIARLAAIRPSLDLGTPVLEQLVAARLLAGAESVLGPRRETLRARRAALVEVLAARLPEWRPGRPAGGLSLWCELSAPVSTTIAALGDRFGVRVAAGPRFGVDGAFERFVRLPYTLPEDELREAVRRLAMVEQAIFSDTRTGAPNATFPVL